VLYKLKKLTVFKTIIPELVPVCVSKLMVKLETFLPVSVPHV